MERYDEHGRRILTAGEVFAERLREVRVRRGWSPRQLAERVAELGVSMPHTNIWKIEEGTKGPKNIRLEEVLVLSLALGVSPLYMIAPVREVDRLEVAPDVPAVDDLIARRWLRGLDRLHGEDPRFFFREQADWELRWGHKLAEQEKKTGKHAATPWLERPKLWLEWATQEEEEK